MGEFELIERFFRRPSNRATDAVVLGIGDDCALLRPPDPGQLLAVSSDMLVEGRHFFAGTDPAAVGHKSLAVNLSDLAAMGARPLGFTLAVALPGIDEAWLAGFCRGMFMLADRFDCPLVGGDTTRGPLTISVTVFGQVPAGEVLRRDAARAGEDLWVSGPLGGAAFAVAARRNSTAGIDAGALRRLDWPEPRVELGQRLRGIARAAIDLSDGLAGDLRHILAASAGNGLMAELFAQQIPLDPCLAGLRREEALQLALHGGDDYEL
ncbi:MAG: thiamine-phosphate kinase, partial [Lautropia sp.]